MKKILFIAAFASIALCVKGQENKTTTTEKTSEIISTTHRVDTILHQTPSGDSHPAQRTTTVTTVNKTDKKKSSTVTETIETVISIDSIMEVSPSGKPYPITKTITTTITKEKSDKEIFDEYTKDGDKYKFGNGENHVVKDGSTYSLVFVWKNKNKQKLSPHWSGVGFSFLNYDDSKVAHSGLKAGKSYNISVNLGEYSQRLGNSNFLFNSGIGLDFHRYHFDDNYQLANVDGKSTFIPAPDGQYYKFSKLISYYITAPLLLEYQPSKDFYISAGVVGFLKYYSNSQVGFRDTYGNFIKEKKEGDSYLRPIDMKFRFQAGIKDIGIFGYVSPFPMFPKKKGPELYPFSLGFFLSFD